MLVLIVETDTSELQKLTTCIQKHGHTPLITDSVRSAVNVLKREQPGLVLLSSNGQPAQVMSFLEVSQAMEAQPPVIVMSRKASLDEAVQVMKGGAHDLWVKPISPDRLSKTIELVEAKSSVRAPGPESPHQPTLISRNPAMIRLKAIAKQVALSNASVFIQGESGTGKELFAKYVHSSSDRKEKPFIALNCAALPETLIESELFGHERGAFTGAVKAKEGKFELANTGTLFLDEITEIPVHLQSKLLRVLQENEVDRVGGKYPIPVDVRVIASTNLVIEEAMKAGNFRKDLYYRLNVIPLKIPPLRERREDIILLCKHFMDKYNLLHKCCVEQITQEALKALEKHSWPGNVRELENVIQRGMLLCQGRKVGPEHLIFDSESPPATPGEIELMPISEMEKLLIHKALAAFEGNRTRAAEILGISVRTLRNKLNEYKADGEALGLGF